MSDQKQLPGSRLFPPRLNFELPGDLDRMLVSSMAMAFTPSSSSQSQTATQVVGVGLEALDGVLADPIGNADPMLAGADIDEGRERLQCLQPAGYIATS